MSLTHQSIATISAPQFINLEPLDINPLMSKCEIKVLYVGKNRNGSFISEEVAQEMAKSLRGAPIVGYYKQDKQDFRDHGEEIILDGDGIRFKNLTKPYGFVSPDAKVWFQDFDEKDDFGNSIVRKYLMTTGFLWTGQFEQVQHVFDDGGKPQSMELDEKSLKGHWAKDIKDDMQFFIINDAIFSKLCILGDDVEPCFEGSAVTAPQVSTSFTLDDDFKHTLFTMMEELKDALKGGKTVENYSEQEETMTESTEVETPVEFEEETSTETVEVAENDTVDFEKKEEENKEDSQSEDTADEQDKEDQEEKKEDEDKEKKYSLLESEYNELKNNLSVLQEELKELRTFKQNIENKQKDDLIAQFYMLSDEDKADVINNKEKYSFEEIESKLAVICFKKKVNFNLEDSSKNEDKVEDGMTFTIEHQSDSTPDWIKEVEKNMNNF